MKSRMGFFITLSASFLMLVAAPLGLSRLFGYDVYDNDKVIARDNDYHESERLHVHMTEDISNEWSFETEDFWGVFTLKNFTAEESSEYTFDCDLSRSVGDFKLVLVNTDSNKTVTPIYDEESDLTSVTAELAPANYAVKAVGRRAGVNGEFRINAVG